MGQLFTKESIRMEKSMEKVNLRERDTYMRETFSKTNKQDLELMNCKNLVFRIYVDIRY